MRGINASQMTLDFVAAQLETIAPPTAPPAPAPDHPPRATADRPSARSGGSRGSRAAASRPATKSSPSAGRELKHLADRLKSTGGIPKLKRLLTAA